jgi:hypothetical protein
MALVTTPDHEEFDPKKLIFIEEAIKITEKLDKNIDTQLIAQLLETINEEFSDDNPSFLLNILVKKYPEILISYC